MASTQMGFNVNYGSRSVTTSASIIIAANQKRESVIVQNVHATQDLYVGPNASVVAGSAGTANSGIKIVAGASYRFEDYNGTVYGIASGATTDVRYFEVY